MQKSGNIIVKKWEETSNCAHAMLCSWCLPQLKTSTHDFIIDTIRVTNPPRHAPLGVGKTWALRWENNTMPAQMEGPYKTRWNHCSQINTDGSSLEVTIPRWVSFFSRVVSSSRSISSLLQIPTSKHESTVRIEPFHPKYLNLRYKEIIFPQKKTSACHWLLAVVPKGPNRWNSQPWWYPNKKSCVFTSIQRRIPPNDQSIDAAGTRPPDQRKMLSSLTALRSSFVMSQRVFRKSRVCSNLALPHQFFVDLIFTTFLTQTANMPAVSWWYWIEKPFNRKGWKLLLQFLIFGVDVGNSNLMTRPNTQPNMVLKKKVLKQKILQKKELCIKRSPWLRRPFLPHLMVGWIHIASRGDVISGSFTSGKSESLAPNLGQGTELREREREMCFLVVREHK